MEALETIHLSAKDLICPICYQKYGLTSYQPMSLSCGHNLCSHCLRRVRNCPLCRGKIHDRASFSKNVLITCILEQKEKVKECKLHSRPLEFFCKDHKVLLCVDCGIEGGHFSHNFVKCKEVDNRAEQIKTLMKKIDTKEEDSRTKFKTFLEKEKRNLKRKVDEILDEYIEPIMAVKKKLKREVDAFILSQSGVYEKEASREVMLKWKKDNETLVSKWEAGGEGDIAAQIVSNETEDIEKRIVKYENRIEKVESETGGKVNFLLRDIKSRMSLVKGPWKKLKGRLNQLITLSKSEIDPRLERQYLVEFLEAHGVSGKWIEKEGADILEVKGNGVSTTAKEIEDKYFDCTLEKLHLHSFKVEDKQFEVVCRALERIISLLELKLFLQNVSDHELASLGESIQKIKSIERFNVVIISERVSEQAFKNFWVAISRLSKLKALDVTLEDCDEVMSSQCAETTMILGKMKSLRELSIRLADCDAISNESFGDFLVNLKGLTHLVKLSLVVCECKKLNYRFFDSLCKALLPLNRLEELSLLFEGFYESSNPSINLSLANTISTLIKLKKLELSFSDNLCLPSYIIRKFLTKISVNLTELQEFSIDLSRCRDVVNQTLESIGASISQFSQLDKLTIRLKMCTISEKGIASLTGHLSRLESLKSLTLDCRHCKLLDDNGQRKALEHLAKLTTITETEFLFGELKHEQQQMIDTNELDHYNPGNNRVRSWSPMDGSVSFDESEILELEEYDDDIEDYDDDDDMEFEDEDEDEFELISVHTSRTGTSMEHGNENENENE